MNPTDVEKEDLEYGVQEHEVGTEVTAAVHDANAAEWAPIDKKLNLKLDLLVIPLVTMIYLLAFLDRANIGNARVVSLTPFYPPG